MKSRFATVALATVFAAAARAQFDPSVISAVKTLHDQNQFGSPAKDPFQPSGFPGLEEKRPDGGSDEQQFFQLINADESEKNGPDVHARGHVEFMARGYHVVCDEAFGNLVSQVFTCSGNVMVVGNGINVVGDRVTVDLINENYVAEQAESQIDPNQLENRLTDKLYVTGKLSAGTARLTHTLDGDLTTCNLKYPHYDLEARDLEIRTGKRAILRDARLHLFGKTILRVPFMVIPLDDRTTRNMPYVGYTDDEGYFVKNTYGIPLKGQTTLMTHEDYMTKLGLGLGGDLGYASSFAAGNARIYKIFGKARTLTFSDSHRQTFRGGSFTLDNDYQKDNYLTAPGQTLLNTRASVTFNNLGAQRATTRLMLNRSSSDADSYSSVNETLGLTDDHWWGDLRTETQVNLITSNSQYSSGTSTTTERMQVRLKASQDVSLGTASLQYQRTIPIGQASGFLGSSDLTPVLSLASDSQHLLGREEGRDFPFKTELSWGEYADTRRQSTVDRTAFSFAFNKSTTDEDRRINLDTNGSFRQGIYSDDTAQYVLGLNSNFRYRLGSDTGINFRYSYLRPYGYSPLSIDSTGRTNVFTTDVNVRPINSLLLGAQTGYDLLRLKESEVAWQQVGLRSEWTPRNGILLRGLYTYDTFNSVWSQLRFDFAAYGRETRLNLNAQYDGQQHTWSTLAGSVDGLRIGRTKISALFSYNGYLKEFDTKQYAVTYDLHCAEAILSVQENNFGFRPGRQIYFMIRIKAFPYDVPFGTGTRGQGVGYGQGVGF